MAVAYVPAVLDRPCNDREQRIDNRKLRAFSSNFRRPIKLHLLLLRHVLRHRPSWAWFSCWLHLWTRNQEACWSSTHQEVLWSFWRFLVSLGASTSSLVSLVTNDNSSVSTCMMKALLSHHSLNFLVTLFAFMIVEGKPLTNAHWDYGLGRKSRAERSTEALDWKLPTPCKPIPQPPRQSFVDYKHVVDVDYYPPVSSDRAAKLKKAAQSKSNQQNTLEYHEIVEDEMIRGLQQLRWKKVDVSLALLRPQQDSCTVPND